jgi:HAMP domain-containing protein
MEKTPHTKISLTDSLKFRINAFIVCIVMIVMGGYTGFDYHSSKARMDSELQDSANITTQRLSKHLREALWALDDEIIDEALTSEMLNKEIFAIQVIDRDGTSIYKGYQRDKNWNSISSVAPISEKYLEKQEDIIRNSDKIGLVKVYVTDRFLRDGFRRSMLVLVATVGLLVVTIVIFMTIVFQRMVINPITEMANLADRISLGELDIKIPVDKNNEIGLLARSFERMQTSLRMSMRRLKKK